MTDSPNDPYYQQFPENPEPPRRGHSKRRGSRGVAGPILAALTVLAMLAGAGWYFTRDTTSPTSQDKPLTGTVDDSSATPTDDETTTLVTPSKAPSKTPTATPSKTPSKTPTS